MHTSTRCFLFFRKTDISAAQFSAEALVTRATLQRQTRGVVGSDRSGRWYCRQRPRAKPNSFPDLQLVSEVKFSHQEDKTMTKKKGFQYKFAYFPLLKQLCPHNSKYWLGSVGCAPPTTSRCTWVGGSKLSYRRLIGLARRRKSCGTKTALRRALKP